MLKGAGMCAPPSHDGGKDTGVLLRYTLSSSGYLPPVADGLPADDTDKLRSTVGCINTACLLLRRA